MKAILSDASKCTGCESCIAACTFSHEKAFCHSASRIKIKGDHAAGVFTQTVCHQCGDAPCAQVCPTGALENDESLQMVKLSIDQCVECRACIDACPFGAISFSDRYNQIQKCDLCGGDPQCVKVCNPGALCLGDAD